MSLSARPVWLPAHVVGLLCGRVFEVLRIDDGPATAVLAAIGPDCGPVIATRLGYHDLLLPPGEFLRQRVPRAPGVRPMPPEARVHIPPLTASPHEGIHWLVPPGAGTTDLAGRLARAELPAMVRVGAGRAVVALAALPMPVVA
ncbi:hypothetical protein ACIOGZ_29620 [Kitasatospora sp. NPDC088160]|uniref:hypothetical protein n=1 Tax=Kitasatospora sp. NPDC088160 TaxID=3364072 RepID=UPI0038139587